MSVRPLLFVAALATLFAGPARAEEAEFTLVLRNHLFEPASLEVPAGQKFILVVRNEDAAKEEFESHDLKLEKVVAGKGTIRLKVGPLRPGEYRFVGEYHEDSAKGVLVAK
jgi:plastocyanin